MLLMKVHFKTWRKAFLDITASSRTLSWVKAWQQISCDEGQELFVQKAETLLKLY